MGHHERVWTVLKRFGYGTPKAAFTSPPKILQTRTWSSQRNQRRLASIRARRCAFIPVLVATHVAISRYLLSVDGIRWLENLFLLYASRDGRMSRAALESLLLPAIPPELPKAYVGLDRCELLLKKKKTSRWRDYPRCVPTSPPDNALSMDSFLLLWRCGKLDDECDRPDFVAVFSLQRTRGMRSRSHYSWATTASYPRRTTRRWPRSASSTFCQEILGRDAAVSSSACPLAPCSFAATKRVL